MAFGTALGTLLQDLMYYLVALELVIAVTPIPVTETEAERNRVTPVPQSLSTNGCKLMLGGVLGYTEGAMRAATPTQSQWVFGESQASGGLRGPRGPSFPGEGATRRPALSLRPRRRRPSLTSAIS